MSKVDKNAKVDTHDFHAGELKLLGELNITGVLKLPGLQKLPSSRLSVRGAWFA